MSSSTLVLGTQFYEGNPGAMRRQARVMAALESLADVVVFDLQWHDQPARRPWIRTVAALRRDSTIVTGCAGRAKPVVSDLLDALASEAEKLGSRYFVFFNSDVAPSPAALALIRDGGKDAYAFSRMNEDPAGRDLAMSLKGLDVFAFDVDWWKANRTRFRPYILGERCWDNVYGAILMCHGNGMLVNRDAGARHEVHEQAWGQGPFDAYNCYLAALDFRYFSLWAAYHRRLVEARRRGASEAEERAIAADVFVWRRMPAAAIVQAARSAKARLRYRRIRSTWPQVDGTTASDDTL